jgi:hypothetical protein
MRTRALFIVVLLASIGRTPSAQAPNASTSVGSAVRPAASLARARTAYFVIGDMPRTGRERQLRQLQNELVNWKRFRLVDRRDQADVTIAFTQDQAFGLETVAVRQRESGAMLWTASEATAAALMTRMKREVPPHTSSICVAFWCR